REKEQVVCEGECDQLKEKRVGTKQRRQTNAAIIPSQLKRTMKGKTSDTPETIRSNQQTFRAMAEHSSVLPTFLTPAIHTLVYETQLKPGFNLRYQFQIYISDTDSPLQLSVYLYVASDLSHLFPVFVIRTLFTRMQILRDPSLDLTPTTGLYPEKKPLSLVKEDRRSITSSGKFYGDQEKDKGLQTSQGARSYTVLARFEPFSNKCHTLVVQFTVKRERSIDCGGGYLKLFPDGLDQRDMRGDSEYNIMFGPDICGPGTKKVHVIFNYKGKNVLINKDIRCKDDEFTHLYMLIVWPDNTCELKIDNSQVESGSSEDDWDFLPPKKIKDADAAKPEGWDERAKIDDSTDSKPEDWDKPEHIPDPDAKKPEDWDGEMDGEWEPTVIQNPESKGEWKPQQIDNPDYKGIWIHPEIDNPEYSPDSNIYAYKNFAVLGLDL
uniref:Calreticulin n=1 Tax=Monodon monoceros TaxID=40151 RepID=A0A8C6BEU8_MONMO